MNAPTRTRPTDWLLAGAVDSNEPEIEPIDWTVLDQAGDCIQVLDTDGRLLATNRGSLARLEIEDASTVVGKPWSLLWGPAASEALDAAMAKGEVRFQAWRPASIGGTRWWDILVTPVRNGRGRIVRLLAIGRDITAHHDVTGKLLHDLRSPLHAILGWLDVLKRHRSESTLDHVIDVIDRNSRRQVQMIAGLSGASHSPSGASQLDAGGVDVGTSVGQASGALPTLLHGVVVLALDDDPDARDLVRRHLEDAGATVMTATLADEALMLLERGFVPDIIVSDIGLPGQDGYQFMQGVRAMPDRIASVPAAAVTALARLEDRKRALLAGYQAHLTKPVDPAELVATVASLTGRTGGP